MKTEPHVWVVEMYDGVGKRWIPAGIDAIYFRKKDATPLKGERIRKYVRSDGK